MGWRLVKAKLCDSDISACGLLSLNAFRDSSSASNKIKPNSGAVERGFELDKKMSKQTDGEE